MAKFNEYCAKCLHYHTRDRWNLRGCTGVNETTAEHTGCMHCFTPRTGSKKGDRIKNLEIKAAGLKAKLKERIYLERELKKTEVLIKKLKRS